MKTKMAGKDKFGPKKPVKSSARNIVDRIQKELKFLRK